MKVKDLLNALQTENPKKEVVVDCYLSDRTYIAEVTGYDKTEDHLVIVTELLDEQKLHAQI